MKTLTIALIITLAACHVRTLDDNAIWDSTPAGAGSLFPRGGKIRVSSDYEYDRATEAAVDIWNSQVGCDLFRYVGVRGDITVRSDDGEPCRKPWNVPPQADDIWAGAYQCGHRKADILIAEPGDIWQQTWIIHHELGHVLGLAHDRFGGMAPTVPAHDGPRSCMPSPSLQRPGRVPGPCIPLIRMRYIDSQAVADRYCPLLAAR